MDERARFEYLRELFDPDSTYDETFVSTPPIHNLCYGQLSYVDRTKREKWAILRLNLYGYDQTTWRKLIGLCENCRGLDCKKPTPLPTKG